MSNGQRSVLSSLSKENLFDIIAGIVLPIIITTLLLRPLLFKPGYIFYGDVVWDFYANPMNSLKPAVFSWYDGTPSSSNGLFFLLLESFFLLFGNYLANKLLTFALVAPAGIVAYFFIKKTIMLWYEDTWIARVSAIAGSVFYLVNWQNQGLITPMYTWAMSYIITPMLVYYFFLIIKHYRFKDAIIFGALTAIGGYVPMWILVIFIMFLTYVIYELVVNGVHCVNIVKGLSVWALSLVSAIVFNAYWLLEAVYGFLTNVGGAYSAYTSSGNQVATAQYLSFYHLLDTLMYGQPSFQFFGYNPQNWTLFNIFIPLAVIIPILVMRPRKETIILLSTALIGVFLAKGFNPPFGFLYYYVLKLSPPGIIGITRDVTPWIMLATISYAFLISLGLFVGLSKLKDAFKMRKEVNQNDIKSRSIEILIASIVILAIVIGSIGAEALQTLITLNYYTYPRFSPTPLPSDYKSLISELYSLKINGNVMWIPTGGTYAWKNGYVLTNWGLNLYPNSTTPFYIYPYLLLTNGAYLGKLLALSDTKYVVYQSPGEPYAFNGILDNYNENYVLTRLFEQSDLRLVFHEGGIWLFENLENVSPMYIGVPNWGSLIPSDLDYNKLIIPSNIWANTSSLYELLLQYGALNYTSSVTIPNPPNLSFKFRLQPNTLVVYGSQETYYDYDANIFKVINKTIVPNGYNFTVSFKLPNFMIKAGIKEPFPFGYGIRIEIYSYNQFPLWGTSPPYNLLLEVFPYSVKFINSTTGYFSFHLSNLNNVSIYVNYYGSSFSDLSPLYYLFSIVNDKLIIDPLNSTESPIPNYEYFNSSVNLKGSPSNGIYIYQASPPQLSNGSFSMDSIVYYPIKLYEGVHVNSSIIKIINSSNIIPIISSNATIMPYLYIINFHGSNYSSNVYLIKPNSESLFWFKTPISGTYTVIIRVINGSAILNGNYLTQNSTIMFSVNVNSEYEFSIKTTNSSAKLAVFAILPRLFPEIQLTGIREINPVTYKAYYSSNVSSILVFTQPYSNAWRLLFNGKTYYPISLYSGAATGFILPAGNGKVTIYYVLQEPLTAGLLISCSSYIILLTFFIYKKIKRRI